jgi:dCMP deaminase
MEDLAKKYLRAAYEYAAKNSTDPTTQNGAMLVNKAGEIVAKGANRFPRGVRENEDRREKPQKYFYMGHAEKYAIFEAARKGIKTEGLTMYCPWSVCAECARAIIQAGIKKVVAHKQAMDKTSPH